MKFKYDFNKLYFHLKFLKRSPKNATWESKSTVTQAPPILNGLLGCPWSGSPRSRLNARECIHQGAHTTLSRLSSVEVPDDGYRNLINISLLLHGQLYYGATDTLHFLHLVTEVTHTLQTGKHNKYTLPRSKQGWRWDILCHHFIL